MTIFIPETLYTRENKKDEHTIDWNIAKTAIKVVGLEFNDKQAIAMSTQLLLPSII